MTISFKFENTFSERKIIDSTPHGKGILYLVSTPIGNLEDITLRALNILKQVDFILAEDTRTASHLLHHFGISKKVISYYSYNEERRIPYIIEEVGPGKTIALIAEAGTPLISDPGLKLVAAVIRQQITVVPVPGASALLGALVGAGIPTDRFVFEGFLPRKKGRTTLLEQLAAEPGTIVLYESPYRVQKTVEDIVKIMGDRYIVIARELTKKFEEFIRGYASDILTELSQRKLKGEIVILITGTDFIIEQNPKNGSQ
jgi:16S rRNA (cytidine1402-2'-O)-methyltransferase